VSAPPAPLDPLFDPLLDQLPRTALIVGKGGVGKTTCAAAIATAFAARGRRTLLLSTDPAAALADVLGSPVGPDAAPVDAHPGLDARQLDAARLRDEFLGRWRNVIAEIVDRGTYLDREDVDGLVDAALPGVDEIFALLALADLLAGAGDKYERVVVDTAPTGHTLRLLALPETFDALVSMLDLMQDKHRFMVRALTRRYRRDEADAFITEMRGRIRQLRGTLADARVLAAVLVTRIEPVVEAESARYLEQLRTLGVRVAAVIVNAAPAERADYRLNDALPHFTIPWRNAAARGAVPSSTLAGDDIRLAIRMLTIVGGKGGVGKSTVSLALALAAVDCADEGDVLLVSTDPAPSIADALGESNAPWARSDVEHRLEDAPRLIVRQMDASAGFSRLRDEYQERIDALFGALVSRGVDVQHDRAILRDLLALAPPGIDELFALSLLGDALAERRFARIIVDPAPTGHLLRLLDMPALALDWSHRLMRLMLKYREVVALGDSAEELLAFARRTREIQALLRDGERAALVIVSLDEPVVRAQTERLASAAAARGIAVSALVWNRATRAPAPLPAGLAARQLFAEEVSPPPIGARAIREWSRSWRSISLQP
jgi:arsenite/tail-anchored protein-transporting ATPase